MKRFWKEVEVVQQGDGWAIALDNRPVRTPARAAFLIPTEALANAVAEEWQAVEDTIDPRSMPLTGIANAAIDRVAPDKEAFAGSLALYAESDLTCYRAEGPRELANRQADSWDAMLGWARRRYDVDFATTSGVIHVEQPQATVERLAHAVAALDAFQLAGLSPLVTIGGSLVIALAVFEQAASPDDAWKAVSIDEQWQIEQWGADNEAEAMLAHRRYDFMAGARFLSLLG